MVNGEATHELELGVPSSAAWDLYGTLNLARMVEEKMPAISKIELVHGDGGLGSILHLIFATGTPGFSGYKEKFTKIDNEKRVKETEIVEGGYLDLGFSLYRVRFEILDKGHASCIVKTTIEYELNHDSAANASLVSVDAFAAIAVLAKDRLNEQASS